MTKLAGLGPPVVKHMILGLSTKTLSALGAGGTLLVVAVTSAVVMADGEEFDAVGAPAWQAGYAFAYDVSGDVEYLFEVPGEGREADRMEFGPVPIEKEILSTQFDLDGKPLYVGAATFPLGHFLAQGVDFEFPDLAVYPTADRQADLAPVGARINDAGDSLVFGPDAPVTYLDFPLTHGKRWDSTMQVAELFGAGDALEGTDYMDLDEVLVQGEVGSMETLSLPIGEVEAVRVDISYTPVGLQKAVAQARADAERFGADIDRLNVQLGVHETAWYAPEYQAVVKDQFIVRALVDAAGEFDGQHYEFYSEATGTALAEMTGAQLLSGPERSMDEILRYLRGEQAITAVHGQKVPDRVYEVSVDGPDRINAALDDPTRFTSSLSGLHVLPDGHSLHYRLVDATGAAFKSGTAGESWKVDIDRPGRYTMVLQAVDAAGTVHAQAATPVVADWYQTVAGDCPAVSGLYVAACDEVDLPVFAGIQSATVAAYHNGTSLAGSGQLVVEGPGERYSGGRDGDGAYRVTIDEFDADALGGDWSAYYSNTAGLGGTVTYVLSLVYGGAPAPADASDAGTGGLLATQDARSMSAFGAPIGSFLEQLRRGEAPGLEAELRALLD